MARHVAPSRQLIMIGAMITNEELTKQLGPTDPLPAVRHFVLSLLVRRKAAAEKISHVRAIGGSFRDAHHAEKRGWVLLRFAMPIYVSFNGLADETTDRSCSD